MKEKQILTVFLLVFLPGICYRRTFMRKAVRYGMMFAQNL